MAFHRGPNIITDGLVMYLDAANPKSYPGSGTTWGDLSGNGNNATLVNGPTFDSENSGSILFDRVNDFASLSEIDIPAPWTTEIVFKTNVSTLTNNWRQTLIGNSTDLQPGLIRLFVDNSSGLKRTRIILGVINSTGGARTITVYPTPYGSSYVDYQLQDDFWKDKIFSWTISTIPRGTANQGYSNYLNGEFISRPSVTIGDDINLKFDQIGKRIDTERFGGNIYSIRIYDRALTEEEVVQNWNVTKSRFGL
jgi:hypothetical protein